MSQCWIALACLTWTANFHALSIELDPSDQTVAVGALVPVDVTLRNPGGALIGGYDVLLSYDAALLRLVDVVFGVSLGGPLDSIQVVSFGPLGSGSAEILEVSFLDPLPQGGLSDFVLFTVLFEALAEGTAALGLAPGSDPISDFLSDEFGFALVADSIGAGQIVVQRAAPPTAVADPPALLLLCAGLIALGALRSARRAGELPL